MIIIESVNHYCLNVSDLDKSIEFYRDLFGFEVLEKISGADNALVQLADVILKLEQVESVEGSSGYICFNVDEDDFDDAVEELHEKDVEIISGPENVSKGKKVLLKDIDGNSIAICCDGIK